MSHCDVRLDCPGHHRGGAARDRRPGRSPGPSAAARPRHRRSRPPRHRPHRAPANPASVTTPHHPGTPRPEPSTRSSSPTTSASAATPPSSRSRRPTRSRAGSGGCELGWRGRSRRWARVCSRCCPATGSTTRRGRRSRTPCSRPTSAWPRRRSWSSGCAPGCASSRRPANRHRRCCARSSSRSSTRRYDRTLHADRVDGKPGVVMVVGVNGVGKTTTVGKIARVLVAQDKDVLLGAADTFRAAAADQLHDLGRAGRRTHRARAGGIRPGECGVRGREGRGRAGGRHRPDRHRGSAAHQDRSDGRARQGQAGRREAGRSSTRCCS